MERGLLIGRRTAMALMVGVSLTSMAGSGGCNRFSGSARIEGDTISFGDLASTMMACAEAAMNQEQKFHAALGAARTFSIDAAQQKLFLKDEAGKVVVQLSAM